jgi:hypothetical protein
MLAAEGSWCHEDLPVDLPGWLAPVARAAGLRREGLTFSYLVLGAPSMAPLGRATTGRARVVSSLLRSKGKREAFLCSDHGELQRTTRLDRDATAANAPWDALARGDVVTVTPAPPPERPRVGPDALVTIDRVT